MKGKTLFFIRPMYIEGLKEQIGKKKILGTLVNWNEKIKMFELIHIDRESIDSTLVYMQFLTLVE